MVIMYKFAKAVRPRQRDFCFFDHDGGRPAWVLSKLKLAAFGLCAMASSAIISTPATAAEILHETTKSGENLIIIFGKIEKNDDQEFKKIAFQFEEATVVLSSDGGYLVPSIEIGKAIRLKGFATIALEGESCNSSCALIWLAGSPRRMRDGAQVGFHSAYTESDGRTEASAVGNAMVGRYLTLLNLPEQAIIFATMAPSDQFTWLTTQNHQNFGIDLQAETHAPTQDVNARRSGDQNQDDITQWKKVGSWKIAIDHTLGSSCFALGTWDRGTILRIGFLEQGSTSGYILFGHSDWKSLSEGMQYNLIAEFDNLGKWEMPMKAIQMGGSIFLKAEFDAVDLWQDFSRAKGVEFFYKNKTVSSLQLPNSAIALQEMISCQKAMVLQGNTDDPFAER
jgi:hypothetical protein